MVRVPALSPVGRLTGFARVRCSPTVIGQRTASARVKHVFRTQRGDLLAGIIGDLWRSCRQITDDGRPKTTMQESTEKGKKITDLLVVISYHICYSGTQRSVLSTT